MMRTYRPGSGQLRLFLLWTAVAGFCLIFIVYPLATIAFAADGASWKTVCSSPRWYGAAVNTLLCTVLSTDCATVTGFIYAYAVTRGAVPFKRFFSFIPLLHLMTPPFVSGLAFILLFGRQGFITQTVLRQDVSLYGLPGLLIAQTLCFFPVAYVILKGTLEGIHASLEQAARGIGAGPFRVFRTVTLPLCLPGLVSAALFISISVLSDFGNPLLIGGRFRILAVEVYAQLSGWANTGTSAVLGILLLIPALLLFTVQRVLLAKKRDQIATIGSRSGAVQPPLPPKPVRAALTVFCSCIALLTLAHFAAIIMGAFSHIWGVDASFTTEHLANAIRFKRELWNSLRFAAVAAGCTAVLSSVSAFIVSRTHLPFGKLLDTAVMLPAAIPGSLVGLAFVLAFNGPIKLTGTRTIIVVALIVSYVPIGYRIMTSTFAQIRRTLDDGARSLGASRIGVFTDILFPLSFRGFCAAFVFCFVQATGTLSTVIFLVSFKTPLTSVTILNLADQGDWGEAAALALILTVAAFGTLAIASAVLAGKRKTPSRFSFSFFDTERL
ncbi:ABC transporter permease [Treponema brennaborense]|uniref:ABC-type transporter, integral membrane subunit n=1 Tax=Treponema brennaborense (strain DSM 12168 / CIP 105900 / DD5/3) TaxID=906968 RepID=F4LM53_TREBD|nr:iron ABC transporter permease [Treponema brennaborense]AEE16732.1 ABC-type transporter, integral membrane subunit [Treponema brennaborense DSM 12168]